MKKAGPPTNRWPAFQHDPRDFAAPPPLVRIALVTDTHVVLEPKRNQKLHKPRFDAVIGAVNAADPDLVLLAGDLTEHGTPEEIEAFKQQARGIKARSLRVLGNHDVGNKVPPKTTPTPPPGGPRHEVISSERLTRCECHLAFSFYVVRRLGLRIVGLNSQLLGSGLPQEDWQWKFLEKAFSRPTDIVLMHQPPFLRTPDEPEYDYWNVAVEPRKRLLDLIARAKTRIVLSGHLHHVKDNRVGETQFYTSPAVSFPMPRHAHGIGWTLVNIQPDAITTEFRPIPE